MRLEYSVVVPVYNAEATLQGLALRLQKVFAGITPDYELVFVDDGSQDRSWAILEELHASDSRLKIIQLMRNFGQHHAILCGLKHAAGNWIVTLDDDLQNPPEEIPKLIKAARENDLDLAIGIPRQQKNQELYRNIASRIVSYALVHVFSLSHHLQISSFRLMSRKVADEVSRMATSNPAIDAMLFSILDRRKISNVYVEHHRRKEGRSGYTLSKLFRLAYNSILNYSTFPLKLMSFVGMASSFLSVLLILAVVARYYWFGIPVMGWASLITVMCFFSGCILFSLGLIGEYLVRIIREVNATPAFVVKTVKPAAQEAEVSSAIHE